MPIMLGNIVIDDMLHEHYVKEMMERSIDIEYTEEELAEMEREYSRNIGYDSGFGE